MKGCLIRKVWLTFLLRAECSSGIVFNHDLIKTNHDIVSGSSKSFHIEMLVQKKLEKDHQPQILFGQVAPMKLIHCQKSKERYCHQEGNSLI
jgi:hypothetical protein